jgi:GNAT superfamily N-acetyltransferase
VAQPWRPDASYSGRVMIDAAAPDEVEALSALAAVTFPLACPPHTTAEAIAGFVAEKLSPQAFTAYLRDPEYDVVTARQEEGALDGYALAAYRVPPPEIADLIGADPAYELSKLYVRPGSIGGGVGYALFNRVLELAATRGAGRIWLGTNQQNTRAQRFYQRTGFERVGTRQFLVGGTLEDDYVFALKL